MKSTKILLALLVASLLCWPVMAAQVTLSNPGFENWTTDNADNWSEDTQITDTQEATIIHGGTYSSKLTWVSQTQGSCDYWNDAVACTEGETYTCSLYVYDNDIEGRLTVYFDYDLGSSSYSNVYSEPDDPSWQLLTFSAVAPAGATTLSITVRGYDIYDDWVSSCTVYIDDVVLWEGPLPATDASVYDLNYPASGGVCYDGPYNGTGNVNTWGILTAISGSAFALQETEHSTYAGIWGYAGSYDMSGLAVGDSVVVNGDVTEYYGLTEIMNITDITVVSTGATVTPTAVAAADLSPACDEADEAYENMLVTISNVTIDSAFTYGNWWASDVTRGDAFVIDNDLLDSLPVAQGMEFLSITGVSKYTYDFNRLQPRDADDFEAAPVIPTLSEWGLIILALLLLAAGTVAIIRKRSVVTAGEVK